MAWVRSIWLWGVVALITNVYVPRSAFITSLGGIAGHKLIVMKTILNFIRCIILIPIFSVVIWLCTFGFAIISFWCADKFFGYLVSVRIWWAIIWLFLIGSFLFALFDGIMGLVNVCSAFLMGLVSQISPNDYYTIWVAGILLFIDWIYILFYIWSKPEHFSGWVIFECILLTTFLTQFSYSLMTGVITSIAIKNENQ